MGVIEAFDLNVALSIPENGDVGVCNDPNMIGLATGNGLRSVCGLPSAGSDEPAGSSSPPMSRSICVGGFFCATLASGGRTPPTVAADEPGLVFVVASCAMGGFIAHRLIILLGLATTFCTCGRMGGGTGDDTTPGDIGSGDRSPMVVVLVVLVFESLLLLLLLLFDVNWISMLLVFPLFIDVHALLNPTGVHIVTLGVVALLSNAVGVATGGFGDTEIPKSPAGPGYGTVGVVTQVGDDA